MSKTATEHLEDSMDQWDGLYRAIKDDSWPECNTIEDFTKLPSHIQLEIVKDHLIQNAPSNVDISKEIADIIGYDNLHFEVKDVDFVKSLVGVISPSMILEVGTHSGFVTAVISQTLGNTGNGNVISLDTEDRLLDECRKYFGENTMILVSQIRDLYKFPESGYNKFDLIIVTRDHSYAGTFRDLTKSYELLAEEGHLLCYNGDYESVQTAIVDFTQITGAVDCGRYGNKLHLFRKGYL